MKKKLICLRSILVCAARNTFAQNQIESEEYRLIKFNGEADYRPRL